MTIREYRPEDCLAILELFWQTVHTANARDYTREQLDAWATGHEDPSQWDASLRRHLTLVAEEEGRIVGFGDMDTDAGHLDRLYVRADREGCGVGTALCDRLEAETGGDFVVHASITARPFFEKRGYRVVRRQEVERGGVRLVNYVMEKRGAGRGTD